MLRVIVYTGSRAEFGLLKPLVKRLEANKKFKSILYCGGSHNNEAFGATINEILDSEIKNYKIASIQLDVSSKHSVCEFLGSELTEFSHFISDFAANFVVILGDRYECLAAASACVLHQIPIVHIHGGEITEGAIDNNIRHALTKLASLHFVSSLEHKDRVIQMGESPGTVFNVGALGLECLEASSRSCSSQLLELFGEQFNKDFFLVTYHPATAADESPKKTFQEIIKAAKVFQKYNMLITYPNADQGSLEIIEEIEKLSRDNPSNVFVAKTLGKNLYWQALSQCSLVLGNSSSGLIEAPSFRLPVINVGTRQNGRLRGANILDAIPEQYDIEKKIEYALSDAHMKVCESAVNPYQSSISPSSEIISILQEYSFSSFKHFYDMR